MVSLAGVIAKCFLLRNVPGMITLVTVGFGWEGCKSKKKRIIYPQG